MILSRDYDLTIHAIDEMAEDDFDLLDVEHAVLNGQVVKMHKRDPRGTKYTIQGLALDGERVVGIVGRFRAINRFLIITVYDISKFH